MSPRSTPSLRSFPRFFPGPTLALLGLAAAAQACGSEESLPATQTTDAGKPASRPDTGAILPLDAGLTVDGASEDAKSDARDAFLWPTCESMPASATPRTISDTWALNPTTPNETWVAGAYVTAISGGACSAGVACQIYLQSDLAPGSLAAGAHEAIKLFASAAAASHFVGLKVNDRVDALGWAWRYNVGGQNELLLQVNMNLPGCARKVGTGTPLPVTGVRLSDLTLIAYENTLGPLLVQVSDVSGVYGGVATATFGLWNTPDAGPDSGFLDAGAPSLVSLSPYFLPASKFAPPFATGGATRFATITGVFGLFMAPVDGGTAPKFLEIYPRTMADVVVR